MNYFRQSIIALCLFLHIATHSMDEPIFILPRKNFKARALVAQEYNKTIPLIALPKELHDHIFKHFVNTKQRLAKSIKNSLSLSATCTHFNNFLPYLGKLHQQYPLNKKNDAMLSLLLNIHGHYNITYWNKHRALFLLVYAGADPNVLAEHSLFLRAVENNDIPMATALFDHNANPNKHPIWTPIFFSIESTEMAQLFVDRGVNLYGFPNILWHNTLNKNPSLIKFYLEKGVNPKKLDWRTGDCLLHHIATEGIHSCSQQQVAEIILSTIPDMINTLNEEGKTPLDCANLFVKEDTITLFRKYGAKTSTELKKKNRRCIIT